MAARVNVGSVPPRLAGWVTDDTFHLQIPLEGAPPEALGQIRYPSIYDGPGGPPTMFPAEVGATETWDGWVDCLNIGDAAGNFALWLSRTSGCTGDLEQRTPVNLPAGSYQPYVVDGTGPIDMYICWMRYVP